MEKLTEIWKDPVWSKVIASSIIGISGLLATLSLDMSTTQLLVISGLLLIFILVLLVLIGVMQNEIRRLYYYDREYIKMGVHYFYTLNQEKDSLDLRVVGERELKCLKRITHMNIGFTVDECFHEHFVSDKPFLIEQKRDFNRQIKIYPPHKSTKSNITFKIEFIPALEPNEIAYFKYGFSVSKFRFATRESLRNAMVNAITTARDYEYNSFVINYPVGLFEYIIEFDKSCNVNSADITVERYTEGFTEEEKLIKASDKFIKFYYNGTGNYVLDLRRKNPPFKSRYKWKWTPPKLDDLK